jgi:hypothetical protein
MQKRSKTKRPTAAKNASTVSVGSAENSGQHSSPTEAATSGSSQSDARDQKKSLPTSAEEADRRFDEGEDLESLGFDLSKATRPGLQIRKINVDLPEHFLTKLDDEAALRGITRQSLIKAWLYDRLMEKR